jgi:hypothetical protein
MNRNPTLEIAELIQKTIAEVLPEKEQLQIKVIKQRNFVDLEGPDFIKDKVMNAVKAKMKASSN